MQVVGAVAAITWSVHTEQYFTELLNHGRSPMTVWTYRNCLRWFHAFIVAIECRPEDVTRGVVEQWIAEMRLQKKTQGSIRCRVNAVRGFYKWLVAEDYLQKDPLLKLRPIKVPKLLPRPLAVDDVLKFIAKAITARERAIAEVFYACGCRRSELLTLRTVDVDLTGRLVRLWGKGGKERISILTPTAVEAVRAWLGERAQIVSAWSGPDEGFLFVGRQGPMKRSRLERIVAAIAKRAGLKASPHVLRHSFATHMLDRGAQLEVVQELLGHDSPVTTRLYTKVSMDRIRQVYDRTHPRA